LQFGNKQTCDFYNKYVGISNNKKSHTVSMFKNYLIKEEEQQVSNKVLKHHISIIAA